MNIKTEITKLHYNKNAKGFLFGILKFASLFYYAGSELKNILYNKNILKEEKVNAQVISIGNLTTGGVGKTPVVAEIAKYLISKGEKVAIISRGYGGELSNKQINVISDGICTQFDAKLAGDEPYWLATNTSAVVITSKDRAKAANHAICKYGATKIILDDGFQHRKLHRDINIVLIDSEKIFGNGELLPAGPLREAKSNLKRADKILVMSKNIDHSRAEKLVRILQKKLKKEVFLCKIEPDYIYNINSNEKLTDTKDIIAMSAIGQPQQFFKFLSDYNITQKIIFDDHHSYEYSDIPKTEIPIVTTEKDAVKLKDFYLNNIYALKLSTKLDTDELLRTPNNE